MSDLGWRAEGIERALAAGGVELETYRRPGFAGGNGVRRSSGGGSCFGWSVDPEPYADEDEDRAKRRGAQRRRTLTRGEPPNAGRRQRH